MNLLKELEINLQELFESIPTAIIYVDASGRIIAANPAAEKILEMKLRDMKRLPDCHSAWKFIDSNGYELSKEQLPPVMALNSGKQVKQATLGLLTKNCVQPRWLKMDAIPHFQEENGSPSHVLISCIDITAQKNVENELKESEEKYKTLVGNMYSSMFIIQNAVVKFANKALEELSGYNLQEILGSNFLKYLVPEEINKVKKYYSDRMNRKNVPEEYQTKVTKKNGESIYVNIKVKPILFGKEPAILVVMTDVDEQVRSEIKLKESEEKFRSIVQSINDGIVYIDENGIILHVNKALTYLFETSEDFLVGKNVIELANNFAKRSKNSKFKQFVSEISKGNPVEPLEIKYKNRFLEISISYDLTTKRVVGIARDLTFQKKTENELLIQSRRTNDALRGANLGTWEWNIQTGKMIFNERCLDIIGYSLVEASGWTMQKWKERTHPEDLKNSEKLMTAHFHRKRKFYECEMRMKHKNGDWVWVMERGKVAIWNDDGNPLMISGTQHDITDRKLVEKEIKESERRLATLMDNLPGIAYRCKNDKKWSMEFISNGCYELTGYRSSELIGPQSIPFANLIHPEDKDYVYREVQKALMKRNPFEIEYRITTADGTEKVVWEKGTGVFNNKQLLFLEGFIHDITADKKAENALKNQEQLLRQIAENYPNSFVSIIDSNLRIVLSAGQEFKNQNLNPEDQKGMLPAELFGKDAETIKKYYQRTFLGEECDFELLISKKYLHFRTVPIQTESSRIEHILVVIENITEKKQMWDDLVAAKEKAEESDRLKSAFLTTMNHELRTPLNHIIGFSEIIRDTTNEEKTKQFSDTIFQSGLGLLGMIEDIFDLALTEKSVIKLRLSKINVENMYLEMKSILEELYISSGKQDKISLIFNPEKSVLSKQIVSDKNKLVQVMINLFKNAIKFTESGTIEFGIQKAKNNQLNMYVKDTGIGIPEDKKNIIFEFFRQGDDSHTRRFGGVGIGLAISKKIAEAMEGSIVVQSKQGKGSTFIFSIPLNTD